jgi:hypothetical protein
MTKATRAMLTIAKFAESLLSLSDTIVMGVSQQARREDETRRINSNGNESR